VAGVCAVFGDNAEYVARQMRSHLKHRGPDDEGLCAPHENVALGHTALFIDDSAKVNQPLSSEDEAIWVTFDGTIYNLEQLKKKLEKNHKFHSNSSAELVVHAYEEEGINCVREFNGDFAFCLWASETELLFSARDKIGVKPLYYCRDSGSNSFLIASEIKALLADNNVPRKPNKRVIYEYLLNGPHAHTGDTFFEGIQELLPAHCILVTQDGVRLQKYWSPLTFSKKSSTEGEKCRDYAPRFLELLRGSVKDRIPENPLIGTFLSGGLDSSSVACLMDRILNSDFQGNRATCQELFSAVYPNTEADERVYADEVAHAVKCNINYVQPSVSGQWDDIEKFVYYMDEPVPVFNYYAYWCLSRAASSKVRVAFSGQGPDETLGGHIEERIAYLRELWKKRKIPRLFVELLGSLPQYNISKVFSYDLRELFSRSKEPKSPILQLFAPELTSFIDVDEIQNKGESLNEFLFNETTQTLLLDHLQFGDRASSAFSTETRYPFLDCRLVEFVFALPTNQKIKNGWTKYILRSAIKGIVPETIRKRRKKQGTPIPLEKWLTTLEKEIKAVFKSKEFRKRGYFNQAAVLDKYNLFCSGQMNSFEKRLYADVFWRILNMELWFKIFFGSRHEIYR